jgi:hypothetical protein
MTVFQPEESDAFGLRGWFPAFSDVSSVKGGKDDCGARIGGD